MAGIEISQEELDAQIEADPIVRSIKQDLIYWDQHQREKSDKYEEKIDEVKRKIGIERQKIAAIRNVIRGYYGTIGKLQAQGKVHPAKKCRLQAKLWARMRLVRKRLIAEHARKAAREALRKLRFV